jgi:hypothetical protein
VEISEAPAEEETGPLPKDGDGTQNDSETKPGENVGHETVVEEAPLTNQIPKARAEHVVFVDPIGTRWIFPYEEAKTWTVSNS